VKAMYGNQPGLMERIDLLENSYALPFKYFLVGQEQEKPQPKIEMPHIHVPWKIIGAVVGVACAGVLALGVAGLSLLTVAVDPVVCGVLAGDDEESVLEILVWHH
jgi:hypothetical protein